MSDIRKIKKFDVIFVKVMSIIFRNIKSFFLNFNGVLLPKDRFLDEELNDMYFKVFGTEDRIDLQNDKNNIRNDVINVKKDFRKSISEYKRLHKIERPVNG